MTHEELKILVLKHKEKTYLEEKYVIKNSLHYDENIDKDFYKHINEFCKENNIDSNICLYLIKILDEILVYNFGFTVRGNLDFMLKDNKPSIKIEYGGTKDNCNYYLCALVDIPTYSLDFYYVDDYLIISNTDIELEIKSIFEYYYQLMCLKYGTEI